MRKEEIEKILAVTREGDRLLRLTVEELKREREHYSSSLIKCVTAFDLPEQVERSILDMVEGYASIANAYEETAKQANSSRAKVAEALISNYELLDRNNVLVSKNQVLQRDFDKLDGLSVWQFIKRKVKRWMYRKQELAILCDKLHDLEQQAAEQKVNL